MDQRRVTRLLLAALGYAVLIIVVIFGLNFYASHRPLNNKVPKYFECKAEILALEENARIEISKKPDLSFKDNHDFFVYFEHIDPSFDKGVHTNSKDELLDPWGNPYIISLKDGHLIITSPGLEQYNKLPPLSPFQKWWRSE